MTTIGYARVSTQGQADNGLSMDAQERAIQEYCALFGLAPVEIIADEGESAKNLAGRPGMVRLLGLIDARSVQHVVVLKMDRMFRSVHDALEVFGRMERAGVEFHAVREKIDTSTAVGRFFRTTMLAMAQFEREQVGERTSFALQDKRAQAGRAINGRAPYGYRWSRGVLVQVAEEQAVIRRIRQMRDAGGTTTSIAGALENNGIRTRSGTIWDKTQVGRVLARTT